MCPGLGAAAKLLHQLLYEGNEPPTGGETSGYIPSEGDRSRGYQLDIRKRQVRYPRMEIDLHTMTGGEIGGGIWRGVGREFVAMLWDRRVGWVEEEGRGRSNSPPGTDDKALVSETKNRSIPRRIFRRRRKFRSANGIKFRFEDFFCFWNLARSLAKSKYRDS